MDPDLLVPLGFFAMIAALVLGPSYMRYRRDLAMIQQGLVPTAAEPAVAHGPRAHRLERALTLTGIGLALTIGLGFTGLGPQLLGGLIPLFIGLSRLLAYLLEPTPAPGTSSVVPTSNHEEHL